MYETVPLLHLRTGTIELEVDYGGRGRRCSLRLILDGGFRLVCVPGERVGSQVVAARLYHPLGLVPNGCLCVANDCLVIHDEVLR